MNKQRFIKATDEGSGKIHWINPIYIHEVVELGDGMWRLYIESCNTYLLRDDEIKKRNL